MIGESLAVEHGEEVAKQWLPIIEGYHRRFYDEDRGALENTLSPLYNFIFAPLDIELQQHIALNRQRISVIVESPDTYAFLRLGCCIREIFLV